MNKRLKKLYGWPYKKKPRKMIYNGIDELKLYIDTQELYSKILEQMCVKNDFFNVHEYRHPKIAMQRSRYWKNIKRAWHSSVMYWKHHGMYAKIDELDPLGDDKEWMEQFFDEEDVTEEMNNE
jgi:hypothetical protein